MLFEEVYEEPETDNNTDTLKEVFNKLCPVAELEACLPAFEIVTDIYFRCKICTKLESYRPEYMTKERLIRHMKGSHAQFYVLGSSDFSVTHEHKSEDNNNCKQQANFRTKQKLSQKDKGNKKSRPKYKDLDKPKETKSGSSENKPSRRLTSLNKYKGRLSSLNKYRTRQTSVNRNKERLPSENKNKERLPSVNTNRDKVPATNKTNKRLPSANKQRGPKSPLTKRRETVSSVRGRREGLSAENKHSERLSSVPKHRERLSSFDKRRKSWPSTSSKGHNETYWGRSWKNRYKKQVDRNISSQRGGYDRNAKKTRTESTQEESKTYKNNKNGRRNFRSSTADGRCIHRKRNTSVQAKNSDKNNNHDATEIISKNKNNAKESNETSMGGGSAVVSSADEKQDNTIVLENLGLDENKGAESGDEMNKLREDGNDKTIKSEISGPPEGTVPINKDKRFERTYEETEVKIKVETIENIDESNKIDQSEASCEESAKGKAQSKEPRKGTENRRTHGGNNKHGKSISRGTEKEVQGSDRDIPEKTKNVINRSAKFQVSSPVGREKTLKSSIAKLNSDDKNTNRRITILKRPKPVESGKSEESGCYTTGKLTKNITYDSKSKESAGLQRKHYFTETIPQIQEKRTTNMIQKRRPGGFSAERSPKKQRGVTETRKIPIDRGEDDSKPESRVLPEDSRVSDEVGLEKSCRVKSEVADLKERVEKVHQTLERFLEQQLQLDLRKATPKAPLDQPIKSSYYIRRPSASKAIQSNQNVSGRSSPVDCVKPRESSSTPTPTKVQNIGAPANPKPASPVVREPTVVKVLSRSESANKLGISPIGTVLGTAKERRSQCATNQTQSTCKGQRSREDRGYQRAGWPYPDKRMMPQQRDYYQNQWEEDAPWITTPQQSRRHHVTAQDGGYYQNQRHGQSRGDRPPRNFQQYPRMCGPSYSQGNRGYDYQWRGYNTHAQYGCYNQQQWQNDYDPVPNQRRYDGPLQQCYWNQGYRY